jgi:hypothetical protein
MPVKPESSFRSWVQQMWRENCQERSAHGEEPLDEQEYWALHRWWLRRLYRSRITH